MYVPFSVVSSFSSVGSVGLGPFPVTLKDFKIIDIISDQNL